MERHSSNPSHRSAMKAKRRCVTFGHILCWADHVSEQPCSGISLSDTRSRSSSSRIHLDVLSA
eukprot:1672193-Prymnesium_polylepis.3